MDNTVYSMLFKQSEYWHVNQQGKVPKIRSLSYKFLPDHSWCSHFNPFKINGLRSKELWLHLVRLDRCRAGKALLSTGFQHLPDSL